MTTPSLVRMPLAKIIAASLLLFSTFGAGGCEADVSDRDIVSIDLSAVRQMVQAEKPGSFKLVDARRPSEFRAGHLPGAMNLPITSLPERARLPLEIESAGNVVVYGQNPGSGLARGVAKRIYLGGQKGVRLFEGGYDAWAQAGLPVTKPDAHTPPAQGQSEPTSPESKPAGDASSPGAASKP